MADRPRISIVTPSFQQAEFLEATIRSVLNQSYDPFEYIVVDGGSTDGSREIIERYADRLVHWESRPDRGQAHAINKGLRRATGDVLAYLNSDDLYLPGAFEVVARAFEERPEASVVYGVTHFVDGAGRARADRPPFGEPFDLDALPRRPPFYQCAAFVRRDAPGLSEGFREDLRGALDFEMWIRIARRGGSFVYLDVPLAAMRIHDAAKGHVISDVVWSEGAGILEEILADPAPWRPEDLRAEIGRLLWKAAGAAFVRGEAERAAVFLARAVRAGAPPPDAEVTTFLADALVARSSGNPLDAARRFLSLVPAGAARPTTALYRRVILTAARHAPTTLLRPFP